MNEYIFLILYIISFSFQLLIKDGVYILIWNNYYFQYSGRKAIIKDCIKYPSSYFRINKSPTKKYYYLQILNTDYKLGYSLNKEIIFIKTKNKNNKVISWNFINAKNGSFAIKNKNNCFIKIEKFKNIYCKNISMEEASLFDMSIIYEEIKENNIDNQLIEKEPIDILIKYIDLRDNIQ